MVARMIRYLYTLDYNDTSIAAYATESDAETPTESTLCVNVQMYILGDKYGIWGLKKAAAAEFEKEMTQKTDILEFLPVVAKIYESTPEPDRGLRDVAVRLACVNPAALAKSTKFKEVVADVPEFACHIIDWAFKNATKPTTKFLDYCRNCEGKTFGKIEKLRCEDCNYLKNAPALLKG